MSKQDTINKALDKSCEQIRPEIEQQLNARRNLVMKNRHNRGFRLSYALAPLALVALVWFNLPKPELSIEEQALYEDLELLIMEDDLEFLGEMDVADWLPEQTSDGDDA